LQVLAGVFPPSAGPEHPALSPFRFYQVRQCNVFVSRVFRQNVSIRVRDFSRAGTKRAHAKPRRTRKGGGRVRRRAKNEIAHRCHGFRAEPFRTGWGGHSCLPPAKDDSPPSLRVLRGFACGISTPSVMVHRRVPATGKRGPCLPSCTQPAVLLSASWSFREPARFARAHIPAYSFAAFNLSYA